MFLLKKQRVLGHSQTREFHELVPNTSYLRVTEERVSSSSACWLGHALFEICWNILHSEIKTADTTNIVFENGIVQYVWKRFQNRQLYLCWVNKTLKALFLFQIKQEAEAAWKLTIIKKKLYTVNQIFELILEQCVANYYGDNTIGK